MSKRAFRWLFGSFGFLFLLVLVGQTIEFYTWITEPAGLPEQSPEEVYAYANDLIAEARRWAENPGASEDLKLASLSYEQAIAKLESLEINRASELASEINTEFDAFQQISSHYERQFAAQRIAELERQREWEREQARARAAALSRSRSFSSSRGSGRCRVPSDRARDGSRCGRRAASVR